MSRYYYLQLSVSVQKVYKKVTSFTSWKWTSSCVAAKKYAHDFFLENPTQCATQDWKLKWDTFFLLWRGFLARRANIWKWFRLKNDQTDVMFPGAILLSPDCNGRG